MTAFAVNCAIAALRKRDIDAQPLLRRAGLANLDFADPHVRVPAAGQGDFLEYAAEAMTDTAFGLDLSEQANPRDAGLLFYVGAAATNLGETLTLFLRYSRLVNESLRLRLQRGRERTVVEFSLVGVSQQRVRQNTEFWIGIILKAAREITGRDIRPRLVACPHARNTASQEFERVYGCPVEFGAPIGILAFANDVFDLPLVTEDRRLLEMLRPYCEAAARARALAKVHFGRRWRTRSSDCCSMVRPNRQGAGRQRPNDVAQARGRRDEFRRSCRRAAPRAAISQGAPHQDGANWMAPRL